MSQKNRMYNPAHPGEILNDLFLEPAGISKTELAERIGVSRGFISSVVNCRAQISLEVSAKLGRALNKPLDFFYRLQVQYDTAPKRLEKTYKKEVKTIAPFKRLLAA